VNPRSCEGFETPDGSSSPDNVWKVAGCMMEGVFLDEQHRSPSCKRHDRTMERVAMRTSHV
jgi:hypothetical protein